MQTIEYYLLGLTCALKINAIHSWSCCFFLSNRRLSGHLIFLCFFAEAAASLMPPVKTGSCLSMDGRRHENEESWHDGCRECYCHNGREMCALITCPVPNCGNPTIHPGQCCPSCPGNTGFLLHAWWLSFVSLVFCFLMHENDLIHTSVTDRDEGFYALV